MEWPKVGPFQIQINFINPKRRQFVRSLPTQPTPTQPTPTVQHTTNNHKHCCMSVSYTVIFLIQQRQAKDARYTQSIVSQFLIVQGELLHRGTWFGP